LRLVLISGSEYVKTFNLQSSSNGTTKLVFQNQYFLLQTAVKLANFIEIQRFSEKKPIVHGDTDQTQRNTENPDPSYRLNPDAS